MNWEFKNYEGDVNHCGFVSTDSVQTDNTDGCINDYNTMPTSMDVQKKTPDLPPLF